MWGETGHEKRACRKKRATRIICPIISQQLWEMCKHFFLIPYNSYDLIMRATGVTVNKKELIKHHVALEKDLENQITTFYRINTPGKYVSNI